MTIKHSILTLSFVAIVVATSSLNSVYALNNAANKAQTNTAASNVQQYEEKLSRFLAADGKQYDYQAFIDNFKIPGMSFAVVDNYNIVFSHQAGLKESGTKQFIDANTAFSTASISKPVTATVAAMLAEQGKLDLDAPVSEYLKSWKMPSESARTITIRQLLAHTAGMSQGGFADFHLGDDIPTLIDSLNGVKLPRYSQAISSIFSPETNWEYSGGGYVIVQVALEDITGKPLEQLAQDMIFTPLNMQNTTMYQHGDKRFLSNVAKVHDANQQVIRDGIPICPQIAPSGMWSTPTDMALFTIEYQKALAGKPTKVVSKWVAEQTTQVQTIKKTGGWAAGWMRFEAQGNIDWFSHGGSNTGTGGHVMASMQNGKGIMVFMNATTQHRNPAVNALIDNIVQNLDWQQSISASTVIPAKHRKQLVGRYLSAFDQIVTITEQGDELIYTNPLSIGGMSFEGKLHYLGENGESGKIAKFALNTHANQLSVETNESQQAYLVFSRQGTLLKDFSMRKIAASEVLPFEVAQTQDVKQSIAAYEAWKAQYPQSSLLSPNSLNMSGYMALGKQEFSAALNFFHVYTHLYPQNANAFDSLAEAQMLSGDTVNAIANYKRSLALNPNNDNAKTMIEKMQSGA